MPAAPATVAHGSGKDGLSSSGLKLYIEKIRVPKFPAINAWEAWKNEFIDILTSVAPRSDFLVNEWIEKCFHPSVTPESIAVNPFPVAKTDSEREYLQLLSRQLRKPLMNTKGMPTRLFTQLKDMDLARRSDKRTIGEISASQILVAFATYYRTGTEEYVQVLWSKLERLELRNGVTQSISNFIKDWQKISEDLGATEYEAHVVERGCPWLLREARKIPVIERQLDSLSLTNGDVFRDKRRLHGIVFEWLLNADEAHRRKEEEDEHKKLIESFSKQPDPADDYPAAPALPGAGLKGGDTKGKVKGKGKGDGGKGTALCFHNVCKVLNNHPKWPLKGKNWSCAWGDTCRFLHSKCTIAEGLKMLGEKKFPPDENGQPRAPSAPPTARSHPTGPKGDKKGSDRGHSPTPRHCKKFLKEGKCDGGKGCPGVKFHLTQSQLKERMAGDSKPGEREDSPHPNKLTQ